MKYNEPKYDESGLVMCEICEKCFSRVMNHVRQVHNLNERQYKVLFGFRLSIGLTSQKSHDLSSINIRKANMRYLTNDIGFPGKLTRFTVGHQINKKC